MRTTGSLRQACPGTMPAESVICGPSMVPAPMWMYRSLKIVFGGKQMMLPSPNAPNFRPARS